MIALTCLLACGDKIIPTENSPVEEVEVFDLEWSTRTSPSKEVIGTDNTQQYNDWVLVGGDIGDPPTLKAFNKLTGDLDWEYIHDGILNDEIDNSVICDGIYIGICSSGIIAIDLSIRDVVWEIDFDNNNYSRSKGFTVYESKLYQKVSKNFGSTNISFHLLEVDINTGAFTEFLSFGNNGTELMGISPPVIFKDNTQREVAIFNIYPAIELPQESIQNIMAIDLNTKDVIWKTENFTNNFASNGGHPPILYNNIVITGGDWHMYAFDVSTGGQLWNTEISDDSPFSIFTKTNHLIHNDRLYVNENGRNVTCLNPATGDIIWNNPLGGPNCTDNMIYYEKEDFLVFTSWGYGSVMVLDALTGETVHREDEYDNSQYNTDVVYDDELDMFFTSTYKHAIGFKINGQ